MYNSGRGVAQDHNEALRLYNLAAKQGHLVAFSNIAYHYEEGKGVPKSKEIANSFKERALKAGFPPPLSI
jgi:TPR repeat protein